MNTDIKLKLTAPPSLPFFQRVYTVIEFEFRAFPFQKAINSDSSF